MISKSKLVKIEIYGSKNTMTYKGRLLGLMSKEEYAALVYREELRSKLSTAETKSISELCKMVDVSEMRLVVVIKEKNGILVTKKTLFITEPLDMINNSDSIRHSMTFSGKDDSYITITEID